MKRENLLYQVLLACATISLLASCSGRKTLLDSDGPAVSEQFIERVITTLSSDSLMGRLPGTRGIEAAASFIEAELRTAGVKGYFSGSFRDTLMVNSHESYNLVGFLGQEHKKRGAILLGAHYDHIGVRGGSQDSIFNGANDNASGVTAVISIASYLAKLPLKRPVIVVLFTGEESGLIGSSHLAKRLKAEDVKIDYMINFEMLGATLTDAPGAVYLTGSKYSNLDEEINRALKSDFIHHFEGDEKMQLFRRSDNFPFHRFFQIPAHTLSSFDFNNFPYYHHVDDELGSLDLKNMTLIIQRAATAIRILLLKDASISLTQDART